MTFLALVVAGRRRSAALEPAPVRRVAVRPRRPGRDLVPAARDLPAGGGGAVGPALSWLIVAHVVLAGWGMFAYALRDGVGRAASLVSAVGFMLAGKWMLHLLLAGHYAFAGLAWLPWTLLGLHMALERRSLIAALGAGSPSGCWRWGPIRMPRFILRALRGDLDAAVRPRRTAPVCPTTHPPPYPPPGGGDQKNPLLEGEGRVGRQHGGRGHHADPLGRSSDPLLHARALARPRPLGRRRSPGRSPGCRSRRRWRRRGWRAGGISGLPEGAGFCLLAARGAGAVARGGAAGGEAQQPRAGVGVAWLAVAAAAPLLARGRDRRGWWAIGIALGLALFALGGAGLFRWVPFFKMFRMPARMFLVMGLPVAYLGGRQDLIDDACARKAVAELTRD